MSSTPEPKTISMVVKEWQGHHQEQYSSVHRINGFPWRLLLKSGTNGKHKLYLVCDKSSESALWQCTATIRKTYHPVWVNTFVTPHVHTFNSWNKNSQQYLVDTDTYPAQTEVSVEITTTDDGESMRRYSLIDPTEPRDRILVVGDDNKKVYGNKQALSSQSPFFDRLFNGDFKEKYLAEIQIGAVQHEEFCNIIKLMYGFDGSQLDDANVHRVLELADRFELKIVEDRVVSYLLASSFTTCLTVVQALLLSEKYNLTFLKDKLLSRAYSKAESNAICKAEELEQLSSKTLSILLKKAGEHLS